MKRETIRKIREAVRTGGITPVFTPAQVNTALGINWAGTFLPKHRVGNPGGNTELFIQIDRGLYKLSPLLEDNGDDKRQFKEIYSNRLRPTQG